MVVIGRPLRENGYVPLGTKEALLALGQLHEIDLKITSALYQSLANKEWSEGERNEKAPPKPTKPPTECWISDTWRFNDADPRMLHM